MNKKKNFAKTENKNNAEYKKNALQKEKKYEQSRLRFFLIVGIIMISVSMGIFFGYCRPFTKFVYYECIIENREWFVIDKYYVKVIYHVDGQEYENILYLPRSSGGRTKAPFYYNANDPNDIMSANRGALLIILPIISGIGLMMVGAGIFKYKKWKNKLKNGGKNNA